MFGGKIQENNLTNIEVESSRLLATIIESALMSRTMKSKYLGHDQRLVAIHELTKHIDSPMSYEQAVHLLVDMSYGLVKSPTCIIYEDPNSGEYQLIARGIDQGQLEGYARKVIHRFSGNVINLSSHVNKSESWTDVMIECPI